MKQTEQFLGGPLVPNSLFAKDFHIIFTAANLLSGRTEGGSVPSSVASEELQRLTAKLGHLVLQFTTIPENMEVAGEKRGNRPRSSDDENNDNNNNNNNSHEDAAAQAHHLCPFRLALAVVALFVARAFKIVKGSVTFDGLVHAIEELSGDALEQTIRLDVITRMHPVLVRAQFSGAFDFTEQNEQDAESFLQREKSNIDLVVLVLFSLESSAVDTLSTVNGRLGRGNKKTVQFHASPHSLPPKEVPYLIISIPNFDLSRNGRENPRLRQSLMKIFSDTEKSAKERELQDALITYFTKDPSGKHEQIKMFGVGGNALVVKLTTGDFPMRDDYKHVLLKPDVTVMLFDLQNPMGRVAIIELKNPINGLSDDNVTQLLGYLAAVLVENPYRSEVYGILTNGTWVQMFRARTAEIGNPFEKVFEKVVDACDHNADAANREKLLDCLEWLLTRTPAELGVCPHPTFNQNAQNGEVTMVDAGDNPPGNFALGALLGTGESCRVYACVPTRKLLTNWVNTNYNSTGALDAAFPEWSFVAKFYRSEKFANREQAIYAVVDRKNIQYTTRMVSSYAERRMILVRPEGKHFRRVQDPVVDGQLVPPETISPRQVSQLVEAVRGLHRAGIVHCDIQHQNIFCVATRPGDAVLNDFGRAHLRENLSVCEFRALVHYDYQCLAAAIATLAGGVDAWTKALAHDFSVEQLTKE